MFCYQQYNCTFGDALENNNAANESSLLQSLGTSGNVAFQLRQLPTAEAFKNPALKHIEYFTPIPVETKTMDHMFGGIKPLYLLDYLQDYSECLKVCVDLWARIKLGDNRPDRCRLVLVKKSPDSDQFKQIVTKKPVNWRLNFSLKTLLTIIDFSCSSAPFTTWTLQRSLKLLKRRAF